VLQCAAVCCSVLQCVAVCCSVLQCAAVCCSVLHYDDAKTLSSQVNESVVYIATHCNALQCVQLQQYTAVGTDLPGKLSKQAF